jgi:4-amino-4-deoxy-L-arabinose transferase-like glycosyltransferase
MTETQNLAALQPRMEPDFTPKRTLPPRWKNPWAGVALLILVGLGFRLSTAVFSPLLYPDSVQYLSLAQDIQSGEFFSSHYQLDQKFVGAGRVPPLYPLLLALFPRLDRSGEYIGAWVSLVFSLATFLPAFWLGRRLDSTATGLLAVGLMTFHSFILSYATPVLTETTFTFFYVLALALGLRAMDRQSASSFALAGIAAGLAYLAREIGITLLMIAAGFALVRLIFCDHLPLRRSGALLAALFAAFVLAAFPYWLHIGVHSGQWGLTARLGDQALTQQILLSGGSRYEFDLLPEMEQPPESLLPGSAGNPTSLARALPRLAWKVISVSRDYAREFYRSFGKVPSLFLLIGLASSLARLLRRPRSVASLDELYFWIGAFQLLVVYGLLTPTMMDERYIYPLLVPGAVAFALGVVRPARRLTGRWPRTSFRIVPTSSLLFLGLAFFTLLPSLRALYFQTSPAFRHRSFAYGYKEAAQELKRRGLIPPGRIFLARKPFLSYYLQSGFEVLPKTMEEVTAAVATGKADYLAVDSFTLSMSRPLLISLAFPDEIHPPWPVIYSQAFPQYRRIITLYDLKSSGPEPDCSSLHQTLEQHLAAGKDYFNRGQIYNGLREAKIVLEKEPNNVPASALALEGYQRYYSITQDGWIIAKHLAAIQQYLQVNPEDEKARAQLRQILNSFKEVAPGIYEQR